MYYQTYKAGMNITLPKITKAETSFGKENACAVINELETFMYQINA
jgi:hypothetical protein